MKDDWKDEGWVSSNKSRKSMRKLKLSILIMIILHYGFDPICMHALSSVHMVMISDFLTCLNCGFRQFICLTDQTVGVRKHESWKYAIDSSKRVHKKVHSD